MNEKLFELLDIDPSEIFGVNNSNLKILRSYFPQLKLIARGSTIKAYGEEEIIDVFDEKLKAIINHYNKYNSLDETGIERILESDSQELAIQQKDKTDYLILHGVNGKPILARTHNQKEMLTCLDKDDLLFAVGPAGTGKTYTAVAAAVKMLRDKQIRKIILTRPAVEAGENLGFLPGDLKEKLDPYMQPLYDALQDMIPYEKLQSFLEKGVIQIAPLAFMRGRTLDDSFVILDEAQNTTHNQMKMFLTRMGKNAKFVVTGDPGQVDLPSKQISGLKEALLALNNLKGVSIIYLDDRDVMRHKLVKKIINAFKTLESN